MKNIVKVNSGWNPSVIIETSFDSVTKITVNHNGGMGGGTRTVYGTIVKEDDNFITIKDFITGEEKRLGVPWVSMITENVTLVKLVTDLTHHSTANKDQKYDAVSMVQYIEERPDQEIVIADDGLTVNDKKDYDIVYSNTVKS